MNLVSTKTSGRQIEAWVRNKRDSFFDAIAGFSHVKRAFYRSITRDRKYLFCRFEDHDIVVDPDDLVGRTLLRHGNFERERTEAVARRAQAICSGRVVIEIGANIGTQTVYFLASNLFDRVICIEPDPINIRMLETNLRLNGLDHKVTVLPVGAGDKPGHLSLLRDEGNSGGSTIRSENIGNSVNTDITVPVITIDSLVEDGTVDPSSVGLLWIDAEGYEEEIFSGCRILLKQKIPMAFEFTPGFYSENKIGRIVALIFLTYSNVSIIDGDKFEPIARDEMLLIKRRVDIFCSG